MNSQNRVLLIVQFLVLNCFLCGISKADGKAGKVIGGIVQGTITGTDLDGVTAGLAFADLTFTTAAGSSFHVNSATSGEYRADLPSGVYRLRARKAGFSDVERAPFRLEANQDLRFDLRLWGAKSFPEPTPGNVTQILNGEDRYSREAIRLPDACMPGRELLIYYGSSKSVAHRNTIYSEVQIGAKLRAPVVATFEHYTVSANQVVFEEESSTLRARGNVTLEDGSTNRVTGDEMYVELAADPPTMKMY